MAYRTAVAWFSRADWDEIKRLCVDDLQGTYDEWLRDAEAGVATYSAQGFLIEKMLVTPADIRDFERTSGSKVNSKGRSQIAVAKLVEADNRRTRH